MKKVTKNIYSKRFGYFNIYIIKGIGGDILIDTGFIGIRRRLKRLLDSFNIKYIILTHAHIDHIWNANYIKKLYNCKIIMGIEDIVNIDNSNIKSKPVNKYYKYRTKLMNYFMRKINPEIFNVDIAIKTDKCLKLCGIELNIITLKGHTNGSIGVLYNDYLFAGDALVNRKWYIETAYQNQSNEYAVKSALKIIKLKPKLILIGHELPIKYNKLLKSRNKIINKIK